MEAMVTAIVNLLEVLARGMAERVLEAVEVAVEEVKRNQDPREQLLRGEIARRDRYHLLAPVMDWLWLPLVVVLEWEWAEEEVEGDSIFQVSPR